MSCSGTRSITLSLYSSGLDSGTTLYPLTELAVDRGRVKLPVEHLLQEEADKRWLPCPGASVRAGQPPPPPEPPAPQTPVSAGEPAPPELTSPSTPWSWWWSVILTIAAGLCALTIRRLPAHDPM